MSHPWRLPWRLPSLWTDTWPAVLGLAMILGTEYKFRQRELNDSLSASVAVPASLRLAISVRVSICAANSGFAALNVAAAASRFAVSCAGVSPAADAGSVALMMARPQVSESLHTAGLGAVDAVEAGATVLALPRIGGVVGVAASPSASLDLLHALPARAPTTPRTTRARRIYPLHAVDRDEGQP